jgi:methionyl aminopeptidase
MEQEDKDIMAVTEATLSAGIEACVPGNKVGDIGRAIHLSVIHSSFHNILEFCGHFIGQSMHEEPQILNAGVKGQGLELEPGMVLCLEPMLKKTETGLGRLLDKWTVATLDGTRATHIEHMVLITERRPEILTA